MKGPLSAIAFPRFSERREAISVVKGWHAIHGDCSPTTFAGVAA